MTTNKRKNSTSNKNTKNQNAAVRKLAAELGLEQDTVSMIQRAIKRAPDKLVDLFEKLPGTNTEGMVNKGTNRLLALLMNLSPKLTASLFFADCTELAEIEALEPNARQVIDKLAALVGGRTEPSVYVGVLCDITEVACEYHDRSTQQIEETIEVVKSGNSKDLQDIQSFEWEAKLLDYGGAAGIAAARTSNVANDVKMHESIGNVCGVVIFVLDKIAKDYGTEALRHCLDVTVSRLDGKPSNEEQIRGPYASGESVKRVMDSALQACRNPLQQVALLCDFAKAGLDYFEEEVLRSLCQSRQRLSEVEKWTRGGPIPTEVANFSVDEFGLYSLDEYGITQIEGNVDVLNIVVADITKRGEWSDLHQQVRFMLDHTNDTLPFYRDERKANRRYIASAYRKMKEFGIEFEVAPIDNKESEDSDGRRNEADTTQVQSVTGSTKPLLRAVQ